MATASVPNAFVLGTATDPTTVNADFQAVVDFLNTKVVHVDASKAFTAVPTGPSIDPTVDNQLARKKYVDDQVAVSAATLAPLVHTHDDRYFTEAEVTAFLAGKSDTSHNHDASYSAVGHGHAFTEITGQMADAQLPTNYSAGDSAAGVSFPSVFRVDWTDATRIGMDMQYVTDATATAKDLIKLELATTGGVHSDVGRWRWTGTGPQITATGTGMELVGFVTAPSDRRLKEAIVDYEVDVDGFLSVPIKEYDYIEGGRHAVGPIAQDVQQVFPELVSEDVDGILRLDLQGMIGVLWSMTQQLAAR